jgi:hypothetical protein
LKQGALLVLLVLETICTARFLSLTECVEFPLTCAKACGGNTMKELPK